MRVLYWLLAAGVLLLAVCESAELAERFAVQAGRKPGRAAAPAPAAPETKPSDWQSAPASGEASRAPRGKGVLIDKATGKRFETP